MNRAGHILLVIVSLFFTANVRGQGDVVMHGDPRLGLLMKKTQAITKEKMIARAPSVDREHTVVKAAADKNIPASKVVATLVITAPATAKPAKPGAPAAVVVGPPKPDAAPVKPTKPVYVKLISPPDGKVIYSGKGYRVQIYNGPDRNKAIDIKTEFMRHNPGIRTYLTYVSPCFRVKVGNYRNRSDAEGMLREAKSTYSPCMIVPDIITVNTY